MQYFPRMMIANEMVPGSGEWREAEWQITVAIWSARVLPMAHGPEAQTAPALRLARHLLAFLQDVARHTVLQGQAKWHG